jgi:hypothetical protein
LLRPPQRNTALALERLDFIALCLIRPQLRLAGSFP